MNSLIDKIKNIKNIYTSEPASDDLINDAQKKLDLIFPEEYISYLKEFGAISFYGTELTGLNTDTFNNVVNLTMEERKLDSLLPKDYFVLESLGYEGILILVNKNSEVYVYQKGNKKLLANSINEYIDICLEREK